MPFADMFTDEDRAAAEAALAGTLGPEPVPPDVASLYGVPAMPEPERMPGATAELTPAMRAAIMGDRPAPVALPPNAHDGGYGPASYGADPNAPVDLVGINDAIGGGMPAPAGPPGAPAAATPGAPPTGFELALRQDISGPRPGGGPVKKVAAADVLQTFGKSYVEPLSPERKEAIGASYDAAAAAEQAKAENERSASFQEALRYRVQADHAQTELEALQTREDEKRKAVAGQRNKVNQSLAAVRDMKVDPDHYWEGRTGARIMSAIAMGLTAYGNALAGTSGNPTLELIQQGIADDIDAQKTLIANAKGSVDQESSVLAQMQSEMLSPEAAEAAAHAWYLEAAQAEAGRVAASVKGTQAEANAMANVAAIDQAKQLKLAEVERAEAKAYDERYKHIPEHMTGGGGGRRSALEQLQRATTAFGGGKAGAAAAMAFMQGASPEDAYKASEQADPTAAKALRDQQIDVMSRAVRLPDGRIGYKGSKEAAEVSRQAFGALEGLDKNIARMRQILEQGGSVLESTETGKELRDLAQANTQFLQSGVVRNALGEGEAKRLQGVTGKEALSVWQTGSGQLEELDASRKALRGFVTAETSAMSGDPYAQVPLPGTSAAAGVREQAPAKR